MKIKICAAVLIIVLVFLFFTACKEKSPEKDEYEIAAEYYDNGLIAVDLTVNYQRRYAKQKEAVFNLFPQGYTEKSKGAMLYEGDTEGALDIISVRVNDEAKRYSFYDGDYNALSIDVSDFFKDDKFKINIKYAVKLPKSKNRTGITKNAVNLGNIILLSAPYENGKFQVFTPTKIGDPFTGDLSDFSVKLTLPSTFTVAASGFPKSCDVAGGRTAYYYTLKNARDFAFVLSEKFNVEYQKWGNRSVIYYFYNDDEPLKTMELIKNCLNFYENVFGKYPFDTFTLVKTALTESGMEYPALAAVSDELLNEEYYRVIAHEIAHQWWYGAVGVNQVTDYFIDEGLAEYSAYLFFDHYKGYKNSSTGLYNEAKFFVKSYLDDEMQGKSLEKYADDVFTSKPIFQYKNSLEYVVNAYYAPFCLLVEREAEIGRTAFLSTLKEFYEGRYYKTASAADFKKILGK